MVTNEEFHAALNEIEDLDVACGWEVLGLVAAIVSTIAAAILFAFGWWYGFVGAGVAWVVVVAVEIHKRIVYRRNAANIRAVIDAYVSAI